MGRLLESFGRFLDLLFPERVYRKKKHEESEVKLSAINEKADKLVKISITSESIKSKRHKITEDLLLKVISRLEGIEQRLEGIEQRIEGLEAKVMSAPSNNGEKPVTAKQILSEYIYGANGDE